MCDKPVMYPSSPFGVDEKSALFAFLPAVCQENERAKPKALGGEDTPGQQDSKYSAICNDLVGHVIFLGGDKLLKGKTQEEIKAFRGVELRFAAENQIRMICWGQGFSDSNCDRCVADGIPQLPKGENTTVEGYVESINTFFKTLGKYNEPQQK